MHPASLPPPFSSHRKKVVGQKENARSLAPLCPMQLDREVSDG